MREICQSGLEGGAAELNSVVPTPIKTAPAAYI